MKFKRLFFISPKALILVMAVSLFACGGGGGGGNGGSSGGNNTGSGSGGNNSSTNNNWDTLVWDQGEWQ